MHRHAFIFRLRVRRRQIGIFDRNLFLSPFRTFFDYVPRYAVEEESRIPGVRWPHVMHLSGDAIEHFVSQPIRICAAVPIEYSRQVVTKLQVDPCRLVAIGMEPGEDLIKALRWDYRISGHCGQFTRSRCSKSLAWTLIRFPHGETSIPFA